MFCTNQSSRTVFTLIRNGLTDFRVQASPAPTWQQKSALGVFSPITLVASRGNDVITFTLLLYLLEIIRFQLLIFSWPWLDSILMFSRLRGSYDMICWLIPLEILNWNPTIFCQFTIPHNYNTEMDGCRFLTLLQVILKLKTRHKYDYWRVMKHLLLYFHIN